MPLTFPNSLLPWTCLVVLFAVSMSCENSGSTDDAEHPNTTDPGARDTTDPGAQDTTDTDSEEEGIPGLKDECPNDPNKTAPGLCGCGIADIDSDSNGVVDCHEDGEEICSPLDKGVDTSKEQFAGQLCCLCENCEFPPEERYYRYLDSHQLTCVEMEFDMYDIAPRSEACFESQREYREICCNAECTLPPAIEQDWEPVETPLPFPEGEHPYCDLCRPGDGPNGQYPLKPYTITAIAYVPGNPTCADLYWMGRTGNLPAAMCYPIQNFMLEPCGCTPPSPQERPRGNEPWCDVCPGGQYPLRLGAFLNDVPGNPMCGDLYWMGRTGNISAQLCQRIQKDPKDPCGCVPQK